MNALKIILTIFTFMLFCSCSIADITSATKSKSITLATPIPLDVKDNKFMPSEKVIDLFASEGKLKSKMEFLDNNAMERKGHLKSELTIIGKKNMNDIDYDRYKKKNVFSIQKYTGNGKVDLRFKDSPIVEQWDGTCTAHGLSAVMENISGINLSERHVWSKYKKYSCEDAINALNDVCVTISDKWPNNNILPKVGYRDSKNCFVILKKSSYLGENLQKYIEILDKGLPVYLGTSVTKSMLNCNSTIVSTSAKTGGGHALAIVGYDLNDKIPGGGYFIIKNSWGANCADKGYQYLPFQHCLRKDLYCVAWSVDELKVSK